ncbi:hypothetical protein [Rathayibacter toxicus]|nr:hypothetical protein [Rathayibacter toxicus]
MRLGGDLVGAGGLSLGGAARILAVGYSVSSPRHDGASWREMDPV